jgi:hypothetical protein
MGRVFASNLALPKNNGVETLLFLQMRIDARLLASHEAKSGVFLAGGSKTYASEAKGDHRSELLELSEEAERLRLRVRRLSPVDRTDPLTLTLPAYSVPAGLPPGSIR